MCLLCLGASVAGSEGVEKEVIVQIVEDLVGHGEDLGFYSEEGESPQRSSDQRRKDLTWCPLSPSSPTMIKYNINNIRELVGHKVNLQMVYDSPLCRLDGERGSRQTQETT